MANEAAKDERTDGWMDRLRPSFRRPRARGLRAQSLSKAQSESVSQSAQ